MHVIRRSSSRSFLLACCLATGSAHAADAVVTACTDAGLNTALSTVDGSGGGTITFSCGSAPVTITFSNYKLIQSNVVIDGGNKVSFDGGGSSAFFQIPNAGKSLVLKNLSLQHGVRSGSRPLENSGSLTLSNVTVSNNTVAESVLFNYGTLIVDGSTFSFNTANSNGVSLPLGGAINNQFGTVQIRNSTFANNSVNGQGYGGAIYSYGTLQIASSNFSNNNGYDGGAIYTQSGTATIKNSTCTSNVGGYGGAIENHGADVYIHESTFTGNSTTSADGGAIAAFANTTVDASEFSGNSAQNYGGTFVCYQTSLTVANSTIANSSAGFNGGGIYSRCGLTLTNVTLSANSTTGSGGGLYHGGSQNAELSYTTFAGNSSPSQGGNIYGDASSGGTLTIGKSIFVTGSGGNCGGAVASAGYNLANDLGCAGAFLASDKNSATLPMGPLQNNGGPTSTQDLQSGNQAIDFVPIDQCKSHRDQRNAGRPVGAGCDSGAVEASGVLDAIFEGGFEY